MSIRIGVDIGGTFTDFAMVDDRASTTRLHKLLTSSDDPSRAVAQGIDELLEAAGLTLADVSLISHGTTLVTNAVIERRGANIGMIVTKGFADVLDMARETRFDLFNLRLRYAEPLVPRSNRVELDERIVHSGEIEKGVDPEELNRLLDQLVNVRGVKALAVCLINSYRNRANEERVRELVRARYPNLYLSVSNEISGSIKEYERWTTTVANAFTQPMIDEYIGRLESMLRSRGFTGALRIMTASGGSFDPGLARAYPVRLIESGPAAGVLMSARLAEIEGVEQVLAFDMGGTTAKGAYVRNGKPIKRYEFEVARVNHFQPGSGLPVRVPVVDMIEIGSGGGSIAEVDNRGLVTVGPRSASSYPGPACYNQGGKQPTLTDANLLLGYLDKDYFLGGEMRLLPELAAEVVADVICSRIGTSDVSHAANGIREIAAEDVAAAFRTHAAELGLDVRKSTMIAFGGSGPLLGTLVARKLKIGSVIFPSGSGVFSAIGLLASPATFETSQTLRIPLARLRESEIAAIFEELCGRAAGAIRGMGVAEDALVFERTLELRYIGQGHQVSIDLPEGPAGGLVAAIREAFEDSYARAYGMKLEDSEVEVTDWRVVAREGVPAGAEHSGARPLRNRRALQPTRTKIWYEGALIDCEVVDRYSSKPGDVVTGPALVQDAESTCVLLPGDRGVFSPRGDLHVTVNLH